MGAAEWEAEEEVCEIRWRLLSRDSRATAKMESKANFDITPLMAPYLDVHMISPMLDFLREVRNY